LQLWGTEEGLSAAFKDIELVVAQRFIMTANIYKNQDVLLKQLWITELWTQTEYRITRVWAMNLHIYL
jgi:hypothetical protein